MLGMTKNLLSKEIDFVTRLRGVDDIYGKPLRKMSTITEEEYHQLFAGIQAILKTSTEICSKVGFVTYWYKEGFCAISKIDRCKNKIWGEFDLYSTIRS